MLKISRFTILILSVFVLALLMSACGAQPAAPAPAEEKAQPAQEEAAPAEEEAAPAEEEAASEEPAAEEPSAMEGGELTFTGWALNEGASRDVIMGYVNDYAAETGATITDVAFPWGETLNQLVLQANGGTAEGAAQLDIAWLNTLAATGKLKDLSEYTEGRGYQDAALASGQVNGVQYGLPWTTGSIGLVANKQILEDAGVTELPTTIEEFEAALEKIKAYDPEIVPYAGMTAVGGLKDIMPWIWTFGGQIIDENGNVTLGDEGSVAALEWYKSLLDQGYMAPEMDRFTARQLFSQGKAAFYDDAIVVKGIVTKDTPIENLGDLIVPVPRPILNEGDVPQSLLWGHIVVVFEGENSDAAAQWAQHLTSDLDTTLNYFETMSLPPTTNGALNSDAVTNDEFISTWANEVTANASTNPFWPYPESARLESILAEQVQAYLVGAESDANTVLNYANEDISDIISGSEPMRSGADEAATEEEPMMEGGEFTFTGWALNEGASRDVIMGYVEEYANETGATVTDVAFPWGETLNQLVLQANGGTAEGAAQLDIAWLNTLAATGKLKDLSEYAEGRGYQEAALASGQVDGVQYGLPWTTGSIGLVANKQILEDAGVTELPTTVEEFEAALEMIKAYDPEIVPYAGMTSLGGLKDIIPWIWTFGGEVIDENGNVTLGDEGSVAALEWYKSLLDKGYMAPEMDRFTARQLFSQGKAAFYDDAIVVKGIVTKDTPIENLGDLIVPVPRPVVNEGDASQSLLWGHIVVVFDGENNDAAAQWAQYLTSDQDTTLNYFETMSLPPTTTEALNSDVVINDEFISTWANKVTATAHTNPFWPYTESARLESILAEQVQAYLVGAESDAQTVLDYANEDISDIIQ